MGNKSWKQKLIIGIITVSGIYVMLKANYMKKKRICIYENQIKPAMDKAISFVGLVLLAPFYALISIAIVIDDPGPVFFTQKRIGKDKTIFELHKFRSMKVNTPHDIPTDQLTNPEQYITSVGRFLRKSSLDELPQIWDIFRGKMSLIGPRPALFNQKDLLEERDKYGANSIMPGLTGWAQINGRDELEIAEKAKMDGIYTSYLHCGGWKAFLFDLQCFFKTIISVAKSDGIVEGKRSEGVRCRKTPEFAEKKIKVSVITPAYNAAKDLAVCIQSVQAQTYPNWEMIIVDDASKDDTYQIAKAYAATDGRIKILQHSKNQGVAAARNTALEKALGDYIAFLDADDSWREEKLYRQLGFMEENLYALTYTSYQIINARTEQKGRIIKVPKKMTYKKIFSNTSIACLTVMVNRRAVGDFRMPLLRHTEDQCTWQDILRRGYVAYGLNENLAYYKIGAESLTKNKVVAMQQQWSTYKNYYQFGKGKALYYFSQYVLNATIKHVQNKISFRRGEV